MKTRKSIKIFTLSIVISLLLTASITSAKNPPGEINGINFENWAAACAHIASGMPPEEVYRILNISESVWDSTNEKWIGRMAQLMSNDMSISASYSNIFSNPRVGKFANNNTVTSQEELLKKVPDYDDYQRIWTQLTKADLTKEHVLADNNLNLQEWGALNVYYSEWVRKNLSEEGDPEVASYIYQINNKWEEYWSNYYKER